MASPVYEMKQRILTRDCDVAGRWRPDAVFLSMQELSGMHTYELGCDHRGMLPESIIWVIYRMRLNIHRDAHIADLMTMRTYHGRSMRLFYPRYYQFVGSDGQLVASASSLWLLMDTQTRRMTAHAPINELLEGTVGDFPPLERPDSVALLPQVVCEREHTAAYSDLDVNGHVNNTRYVTWLCDMLGTDCLREQRIASLLVNYRVEIRPDARITLRLSRAGNAFSLEGMHGEEPCFACGGHLAPRDGAL